MSTAPIETPGVPTHGSVLATPTAPSVESILAGLTEEQRQAVIHGEGPLLIVAGAGTGKTTVITRRISWLIATRRARPSEILALTFTEKAAQEMQERVDCLVPYGYTDLDIGTFHAFGYRILRDHALEIGLDPRMRVLSRAQQIIFLREHLFELPLDVYRPLGNPTAWLGSLVAMIGRAKDEGVSPARYLEYAQGLWDEAALTLEDEALADHARRHLELAQTYRACQELMARHGFIDFGDQVYRLLELFRQRPSVLEACQQRYRYILVDEFQDTNRSQSELVHMLARGHRNLTVVGDDDQAIYRFRGAAISNILGFVEQYPEARQVVLTHNFRSPQPVLDAAYRLIVHNNPDRLEVRNGIDKRLEAVDRLGGAPSCQFFDTVSSEADEVARMIEENVEASRFARSDHAILVRSRSDAEPFVRTLTARGIPFRFSGSQNLYARPEVRMVIDFLRATADCTDSLALFSLASSEVWQVDPMELSLMSGIARRRHASLYDVMQVLRQMTVAPAGVRRARGEGVYVPEDEDVARLASLSDATRATVLRLLSELQHYVELSVHRTAGQVTYQFMRRTGLLARLARQESAEDELQLHNIARFFDVIRSFEELEEHGKVPQFVRHLDLLMEAGDDPPGADADADADAVQVLTVHKAKGLEFPVVFLVEAVDGRFPPQRRAEPLALPTALTDPLPLGGDAHMQEERRLFYVAMTRARKHLHVMGARVGGGRRPRRISPFVLEALDLPRLGLPVRPTSAAESIHRFAETGGPGGLDATPMPEDATLALSHQQIDDYGTCPLKYKYAHVLRVPLMAHHSVVYGRALHEAISCCNQGRQRQADGGEPITLDEMLEAFSRSWINEGFLSPEHEAQRYAMGRRLLGEWFAREQASARTPSLVEREFSFWLGRNRINGRYDRVDRWDGGAAIIDYKSTTVRSQEEADRRARENLQLSIYALAFHEQFGELPDYVELQFLESGTAGRARKTHRDLDETRAVILEVAAGLRARRYPARPEYTACGVCAFREFCPAGGQRVAGGVSNSITDLVPGFSPVEGSLT